MSAIEEAIKQAMAVLGQAIGQEPEGETEVEGTEPMDTTPEHEAMESPEAEQAEHATGMEMSDENLTDRSSLLSFIGGKDNDMDRPMKKKGMSMDIVVEAKKGFNKGNKYGK